VGSLALPETIVAIQSEERMGGLWTGTAGKVEQRVWPSRASRFFRVSGFTLVEVVLAMAFLGLVVVSMATILAGSLRRHSGNTQEWTLLLVAQRTMEKELTQLSMNQGLFASQVARGTWQRERREGLVRITVVHRSVGEHMLRVQVTARASGKRVELVSLVGDRWVVGTTLPKGKGTRKKKGH